MRLDKFLSQHNIGTRSEVKKILKNGRIRVNGEIVKAPEMQIGETDIILADERVISHQELYYYMFHKPAGCVSACSDREHETVMDYFKGCDRFDELFPVGRLDKDTEGLLIVTNDGDFSHRLTSPGKHVEKRYYFRSAEPLDADAVSRMAQGITLRDGTKCSPAGLLLREEAAHDKNGCLSEDALIKSGGASMAEGILTITEGAYHQVKRMVAACGGRVIYLKRLSIGNLSLDPNLGKGAYRELTEEEKCLAISPFAEKI
ncbi:MAG: rRNA pseudouridine synthase [Lachnospiraceae bacterium]|jgi:16S rRNA pseudouridine516 synthase|nr:rRNA pseudouridine synthase [Lachnospiraceae bacterium]